MSDHSKPPGRFISLDGPDGGGKTTQAARLVARLRDGGREVVSCRDPGGTPLGDRLRAILLDRGELHPVMRAEMLLFMASRAQLVDEVIRPALDRGAIVVSDRFLLANVVYQGYAGGLPVEELWTVGKVATGGLFPDLILLLDLPLEVAQARVGTARDRMEDRPEAYHRAVREGFLTAAKTYPAPLQIIDAGRDPEVVAHQIQAEVDRVLALDPRA
jgi:dTMP kinase